MNHVIFLFTHYKIAERLSTFHLKWSNESIHSKENDIVCVTLDDSDKYLYLFFYAICIIIYMFPVILCMLESSC